MTDLHETLSHKVQASTDQWVSRYSLAFRQTFSTPAHLHIHGGAKSRTHSISSGPFTRLFLPLFPSHSLPRTLTLQPLIMCHFPPLQRNLNSPKTAALTFIHDTMTATRGCKDSGSGQCRHILATCTIALIYRA